MAGQPLLKPSEKKTARSNAPAKMSTIVEKKETSNVYHGTQNPSRFERLKQVVRSGLQTAFEVGTALLEIREDRLYQHEFATFEAFCESEFKIVRSRAYQLIEAAQVKEALPPGLSKILDNDAQARALAPVPIEQRAEVLEKVVERGTVTAKAITEAARELPHPSRWTNLPTDIQKQVKSGEMSVGAANALYDAKGQAKAEPSEKYLDKTGYVIPDSILEDWQRALSYRSTISNLQVVKLDVGKRLDENDLIFREIGQDTLIEIQNAWANLKSVLPYAVCPTCQGRKRENCTVCKGRGFVSEFAYKHWFAKEVIDLRERAIKK